MTHEVCVLFDIVLYAGYGYIIWLYNTVIYHMVVPHIFRMQLVMTGLDFLNGWCVWTPYHVVLIRVLGIIPGIMFRDHRIPVISVYPPIMMEARMDRGVVLVNVVNALKDIVTDCNIECGPAGISLQVRIYTYHTYD